MKTTTKITLSMATMVLLSGGLYATCASTVDMGNNTIVNLGAPTDVGDAANKEYVDGYVTDVVTMGSTAITAPAGYNVIYKGRRAWLDRDVGATTAPTAWNDTTQSSLGSLFQWGRAADGHQFRDIGNANNDADVDIVSTASCSTVDAPGANDFFSGNAIGDYNWRTVASDCNEDARRTHFWSGIGSDVNGVCPAGWMVPTEADFRSLDLESASDAFDKIKLSLTGYRSSGGGIYSVGSAANYWTSTVDGSRTRSLGLSSLVGNFNSYFRAYGFSVRCVKHLID